MKSLVEAHNSLSRLYLPSEVKQNNNQFSDFKLGQIGTEIVNQFPSIKMTNRDYSYPDKFDHKTLLELYAKKNSKTSPQNISKMSLTSGGKHAIYLTLSNINPQRRKILLPNPGWPPYRVVATSLGYSVEEYNPLNFEQLVGKLRNNHKGVVILNYPNNPTGHVLSSRELSCIVEICHQFDIEIVSDEVYRLLVDHSPSSLAEHLDNEELKISVIDSMSKWAAIPSCRIGFLAARRELISRVEKCIAYTTSCVTSHSVKLGIEILENREKELAEIRSLSRTRVKKFSSMLKNNNVEVVSEGAIYVWVKGQNLVRLNGAIYEGTDGAIFGQEGHARFCPTAAVGGIYDW